MGYVNDPSMVRVDFFKPNGKWYNTEAVRFSGYDDGNIHQAFAEALRKHFADGGNLYRLREMDAVCLEPYHKYAHPIMLKAGSWLTVDLIPLTDGSRSHFKDGNDD